MNGPLLIHWFRQDLRLRDNPALWHAARKGRVLPVYILDDLNAEENRMGGASRWWLHRSIESLNRSLKGKLALFSGDARNILPALAAAAGADAVYWNRCYEPWRTKRDSRLEAILREQGLEVESFNGSLLAEPWELLKKDGTPYRVFTAYYRNMRFDTFLPRPAYPPPERLEIAQLPEESMNIPRLGLLSRIGWERKLERHWEIGETGAMKRLDTFLRNGLDGYHEGRNIPAQTNVSRLSGALHFGEISVNTVWHALRKTGNGIDTESFLRQLAWRDYSSYLLFHHPTLPENSLNETFETFPWQQESETLECWQKGLTGYPIVDAGMRELWQTGYMHNRVRMIAGSFLVKNLLVHWHHGKAWFWNCLADADLAANSASWQWVSGCGVDAAPYFRIFNPVMQARTFDPHGNYIRGFLPELTHLPDRYLFAPWEAPPNVLKSAGVILGKTYPRPVVELKTSRMRALDAYAVTTRKTKS